MQIQTDNPIFTRLYLIRHGQTDWNLKGRIQGALDIPLNNNGKNQATKLFQLMEEKFPFDVIYSSPATRALETAKIIKGISKFPFHIDPNLREINFGNLVNHSLDDLGPENEKYIDKFNHFLSTNRDQGTKRPKLPKGEEISNIEKRIKKFVGKILNNHAGKRIAVVSHGSFLKCMITYFSGESLNNYMPYWIENASLSIVDLYGKTPIIRMLNNTGHQDNSLNYAVPRIF